MKESRLLSILTVLILLSGCKSQETHQSIESDVLVKAWVEDDQFFILASTATELPCFNYEMAYSSEIKGTSIQIRFKHINDIEVCLRALGPATARIPLTVLPNRTYDVTFILNGETTRGTLTTNPLLLELEPDSNVRTKEE